MAVASSSNSVVDAGGVTVETIRSGLRGSRLRYGSPPETDEPDRSCIVEGCETVLSIYNLKETCWPHTERTKPRVRGADSVNPRCRGCGISRGKQVRASGGRLDYDDFEIVEVDGIRHLGPVDEGDPRRTICTSDRSSRE